MHTYPTADVHILHGLDCWCSPRYMLLCDECEDGCWKCDEGLIPLTRAQAEASEAALVVVHNR